LTGAAGTIELMWSAALLELKIESYEEDECRCAGGERGGEAGSRFVRSAG